jgi:toxin ParE1/3/4
MRRIQRAPRADLDLEEIWLFIAQNDPAAADRWLDTLEDRTPRRQSLTDNPLMGPSRPDIAREVRYHPVGNHLRVIRDGIQIVRVVHGAGQLLDLL